MDFRGEVIKEIYVIDEAWEGFHVLTNKRSIEVYISNDACCCESWGHLSSVDDPQEFVGAKLLSVTSVDSALNEKTDPGDIDEGTVYFVNFKTDRGILQLAVYDNHNGYYGHSVQITGLKEK